ncbi:protein split ends isoform X2 [Phlebotomus argentipes]|uniref:protein split ends isoform X2 n=1 Tax=Phlebotomus argentipes TaxID=94469 RepID=UPI002892FF69|nr:protein split ends isoform X2 [Phlebotomus argentipes]
MIDRSAPVNHHRVPTNSWYESNSSANVGSSGISGSGSSRYAGVSGVCNSSASSAVDPAGGYDLPLSGSALDHRIERRNSETSETASSINKTPSSTVSGVSNSNTKKKNKSRSGSESPCGGSLSSRSHSRSPSSCSSTNSSSSNSHGSSSSPNAPGESRTRGSGQSGAGSSSSGNPATHSEDNRPLAICVRNLPARSSDTSLKDGLFHEYKKHGKVTWVKVVGQSTDRYALVCFKKADDVEKALEVSHDKLFFGCKIEVAPYQGYDVDDNEFRPYEAELDEYHPKSTRTLFIGNLEKEITSSDIRKQFESFGEIIEIDVKKQGISSYAFCQYADIVSVVKAMRKMDGEHLGNNRIKLGFGKSMPTNCVWIDGIADSVSETYLTTQFARFGPVTQITIDKDRRLALVFFEQIQYAQLAVKEMRGIVLRGRKLQVDFASRECQDAFYDKMKKSAPLERDATPSFDGQAAVAVPAGAARSFEPTVVTATGRFSRYDGPPRSRTSSFSRHGSITGGGNSGAASPVAGVLERSSSGSTTPRGAGRPRVMRYNTVDFYDGEYSDRRSRNYDEYSQGSGASHDGDGYDHSGSGDVFTSYSRGAGGGSESPPPARLEGGNGGIEGRRRSDKSPGDIRHLQKERVLLLEQLEECPSSGDELMSPKKRIRYDSTMMTNDTVVSHQSSSSIVQNNNVVISDSICDASINHNLESSLIHHHQGVPAHPHRKVEVRRLSECSQKLAASGASHARRPSTDSGGRHHEHGVIGSYGTPHVLCKRRKTGSIGDGDHHTSRGRGHQLHSHHSHEASGGESADGSRPGTPLCDERPESVVPTEPRRMPRERPHNLEPMLLPLPRFSAQFYLQNRLLAAQQASAASAATTSTPTTVAPTTSTPAIPAIPSSLQHSLSSPPPNSILVASSPKVPHHHGHAHHGHHHHHHHHHHPPPPPTGPAPPVPTGEQPPESPLRPPSLSSNSSDSEVAPSCSPSLEERIKTLDEMFEKWNGNNANRGGGAVGHASSTASAPAPDPGAKASTTLPDSAASGTASGGGSTTSTGTNYRHKFLDLDVNEVQPSDIVKSVLAKKSIFDEDSKRLENIGDKYEPREYHNFARSTSFQAATPPLPGTPSAKTPTLANPPIFPTPAAVTRLANPTASPLNSPIGGMSSPYNSPSPSPVTPKPNTPVIPAKGLQYPFPSHPPAPAPPVTPPAPTPSAQPPTTQPPAPAQPELKPKNAPITKSISLQEKSSGSGHPNRVLNKSTSMPGSTNSGTTKPFLVKDEQDDSQPQTASAEKEDSGKRHNCTTVKEESKRRPDSLDRRKLASESSTESSTDHPTEHHAVEDDRSESEEKARQDRERREREKRREREEKERQEAEEKERREREEEAKRREEERREKEEKERKDREERERLESERKAELEREENERREAEERRHQVKDKENRENPEKFSSESTSSYEKYDDVNAKRRERNNSRSSSPSRSINKRRLSSQENYDLEEIKRLKTVNDHRKMSTDRKEISRDSHGQKNKHHKDKHRVPGTTKNGEDRPVSEDRCRENRKDSDRKSSGRSSGDKHKSKSNRSRTDDHHHHMNNIDHDMSSPSERGSNFLEQLDMRSSEEEQRQHKKEQREKKRDKLRSLSDASQQEFSGEFNKHEMRSKESGENKKRSGSERRGTTDENILKTSSSSDNSRKGKSSSSSSSIRKMNNSSDSEDSDEPKKHSIFDIPDEGPTYISMYDKVKARSCKNMQRQEEEKKIKAKFTQLKQSRAKREEKKRSTSWDDDTDSEMDDRRSVKSGMNHKKINSSSEDEMLINRIPKTEMISDSETEMRRSLLREKINELCDGESSEASAIHQKPRRKISSRKNSRSTRIASDSSDDEALSKIKEEKMDTSDLKIKSEVKAEIDEKLNRNKLFDRSESEETQSMGTDLIAAAAIKMEPKDESGDLYKNSLCNISSDEHEISVNSTNQKDPFDQLFSPDTRKKHKKKQKRQKSVPPTTPTESSQASGGEKSIKVLEEVKMEKQVPLDLFDELKKNTVMPEQKKKHSSRKDKKRDRLSKEDYENRERFRDERSGKVKKNKKSSKMSDSYDNNQKGFIKGGEKMEDIFGPLSDDDTIQSFPDMVKTEPSSLSTSMASIFDPQSESIKKEEIKAENPLLYPSKGISGDDFKSASTVLPMQSERERHKDESRKRKEKKRREREKSRAVAVVKEDENSVDLDEAGRALEAQLMKDMDTKFDEMPNAVKQESRGDVMDVFRFTDGDDSIENVMSKDKEKEASGDQHRSKEKKKKKKRSKEEKHQRREHHQSKDAKVNSSNVDKLVDEQKLSKQSPSLPCLLEESPPPPPSKNANLSVSINREVRVNALMKVLPSLKGNAEAKQRKPEKFIPGFGGEVDETIHESAVKSISTEFTKAQPEKGAELDEKIDLPESDLSSKSSDGGKGDDKTSRVIISQEETEDAVAALLGESFGSSIAPDYTDCYESPAVIEESPTSLVPEALIPEEDAEEMRKAVQSLNTEELDLKPDTPQSEHDLQIDTDTEEQEEESGGSGLRLDQPPKTPDVDLAAIRQEASEKAQVPASPKQQPSFEKTPETPKVTTTPPTTGGTSVITKTVSQPVSQPEVAISKVVQIPVQVSIPSKLVETPAPQPLQANIVENPAVKMMPASSGTIVVTSNPPQTRASNIMTTPRPQLIYQNAIRPGHPPPPPQPQHFLPQQAPPQKMQQPPRPPGPYLMQPPTINIPEQPHYVYQPIGVMMSPRNAGDPRLASPRQQQPPPQPSQPQTFGKNSSQLSPTTIIRGQEPSLRQSPQQLSPAAMTTHHQQQQIHAQHMIQQQQRQMLSPSGQHPMNNNLMMNRVPVAPILTPISKPMPQPPMQPPMTSQQKPQQPPATQPHAKEMPPQTVVRVVQTTAAPSAIQVTPKIVSQQTGQIMTQLPKPPSQPSSVQQPGEMMDSKLSKGVILQLPQQNYPNHQVMQQQKQKQMHQQQIIQHQQMMAKHQQQHLVQQQQQQQQQHHQQHMVQQQQHLTQQQHQHLVQQQIQIQQQMVNQQKHLQQQQQQSIIQGVSKSGEILQQSNIVMHQSQSSKMAPQAQQPIMYPSVVKQTMPSQMKVGVQVIPTATITPTGTPQLAKVEPEKKELPKDQPPASLDAQEEEKTVPKEDPPSVIKSGNSSGQESSSLLTEENVIKLSSATDEHMEQDSKEDSDYWSAKEVNIESVIKKVDALCSGEDTSEEGSEVTTKTADWPEESPSVQDSSKVDGDARKETPLVAESAESKISGQESQPEVVDGDEEFDEGVCDNPDARDGARKRGRGVRGRKTSENASVESLKVPANNNNNIESPDSVGAAMEAQVPGGVQTRRGGKTANRRKGGRVTRGTVANVSPSTTPSTSATTDRKTRNQNSESDVYEFHEDSGEEVNPGVAKASAADDGRPRLILTIKSPAPGVPPPTTSVPGSVQPIAHPQPSQPPVAENMSVPQISNPSPPQIPASGGSSNDDFTSPAANTRKSRRLQERDGRSTVDDIIEDVVKNVANSPKAGSITPPRRTTRSTMNMSPAPVVAVKPIVPEKVSNVDVRKSPRANRTSRNKDRKLSETSTDSSEERKMDSESMMAEEKQVVVEVKKLEQPQPENLSTEKVKTVVHEQPMKPEMVPQPIPGVVPNDASTTLIDPVTGELMMMRQSKEGQYIPVPRNANQAVQQMMAKQQMAKGMPLKQPEVKPQVHQEPHIPPQQQMSQSQMQQIPLPPPQHPMPQPNPNVATVSVVSQGFVGKQIGSTTVTNVSIPLPMPVSAPISVHPTSSAATIITSSSPQQQSQPPRTHPLKAHMLNSQATMKPIVIQTMSKPHPGVQAPPQQTQYHMPPTSMAAQPQQVHMKAPQPVQQSAPPQPTPSVVMQNQQGKMHQNLGPPQAQGKPPGPPGMPHNLIINVPPVSSASPGATLSPRVVQHPSPMKQQITITQQQTQPSAQNQPQPIHLGQKGGQSQASASPQQQQQQQTSQMVIHGGKMMPQPPPTGYATVLQSGKVIQPSPPPPQIQSPSVANLTKQQQQHMQVQQQIQQHHQQQLAKQQHAMASQKHHLVVKQQQAPPQQQPLHLGQSVGQATPQQQQHMMANVAPSVAHQATKHIQTATAQILPPGMPPQNKGVMGLHQSPQILTGAVASPPPKQPHLSSQQPIVTGASSSRVTVPPISPQGQARGHILQAGLPVPAFEASLGEGPYPPVPLRGVPRDHHIMMYHHQYIRAQEALNHGARIPYHMPRSPMLPGAADQKSEISEMDDTSVASPPLELRRPASGPRTTTAVPHSLQSPQDRATDSPQVAQVYVSGTRIPHPHYPDAGARSYYESAAARPLPAEPPPAHRPSSHSVVAPMSHPPTNYGAPSVPTTPTNLSHMYSQHPKTLEREREQRERDKERENRASIPSHANMPSHGTLVPAMPAPTGRNLQAATPPHASQVPPQADSLLMLLQRYPVMWQGLLALKNDQAAVQMHFVFGNPQVAGDSLPCNSDGSTPPLRIAQRMRLEQTQLEGVARKMQTDNEHCMLLALPCGRDHLDVLQQSKNLQSGFITYLQQKQAAGIVNIAAPGSQQAAYVVHIFPSCDFANDNLARIAPDLLHRVADIAHLLIVIATV